MKKVSIFLVDGGGIRIYKIAGTLKKKISFFSISSISLSFSFAAGALKTEFLGCFRAESEFIELGFPQAFLICNRFGNL